MPKEPSDEHSSVASAESAGGSSISSFFLPGMQSGTLLTGTLIPTDEEEEHTICFDSMVQRGGNRAVSSLSQPPVYSAQFSRLASTFVSDESFPPLIDFSKDLRHTMTFARRIALYLMKRYKWYNPKLGHVSNSDAEAMNSMLSVRTFGNRSDEPSLEEAWEYFEHYTLPRYKDMDVMECNKSSDGENEPSCSRTCSKMFKCKDVDLQSVEPGERKHPSLLYSPILTPLNQMGDFGIGFGLYFCTLRAIALLSFLAGILNIPNLLYYAGPDYSQNQEGGDVPWFLRGSAACNVQQWVPCPNCTSADFRHAKDRFEEFEDGFSFALKNMCDGATYQMGMINVGSTLLFIVGMLLLGCYLNHMEVVFDEDEQTTQDYSIVISNPPQDAYDEVEWKSFFESNFIGCHVTCCTIGINNDYFLKSLVKRRKLLQSIEEKLGPDVDISLSSLSTIASKMKKERGWLESLYDKVFGGVPENFEAMVKCENEILELASESRPVTNVFVTFEKEEIQRSVLEKMMLPQRSIDKNKREDLPNQNLLFRNNLVLDVKEAAEPDTLRWDDLNTIKKDTAMKALSTVSVCGVIVLVALVVKSLYAVNQSYATMVIAFSNYFFPVIAKLLTNFERHANEEDLQIWLFVKIAFFRCFNTAVVISLITPTTSQIMPGDDKLLNGVYKIFFAELITANVMQILDLSENAKRHLFAPRSKCQESMNLLMRGSVVHLSERYTNMTKILFLALWYCSIYPGLYFFCSLILLVNSVTDKFSLMRSWRPSSRMGRKISSFSRYSSFPILILAMAIMAARNWKNSPHDNLCLSATALNSDQTKIYKVPIFNNGGNSTEVRVDSNTALYEFCSPAFDLNFMKSESSLLSQVYSIFQLSLCGLVSTCFLVLLTKYVAQHFYNQTYVPRGEAKSDRFSSIQSTCYIPQVKDETFAYPMLAFQPSPSLDALLKRYHLHHCYSLADDYFAMRSRDDDYESEVLFSKVTYWEPEDDAMKY